MVGHNIKNKESLNSGYICPYCSLLLRDPVQFIDCGHRLCQSCLDEQKSELIICPECHERTPREKLKPDRGFKNDMQILVIICVLCDWTGVLKKYEEHLIQFHPNPVCVFCGEKFRSVNDLNRHQQFICTQITVYCPFKKFGCEEMILRINLHKHFLSEQHQRILMNVVRHLKSIHYLEISSQMIIDLPHTLEITTIQLQEIDETVNILSGGMTVLNDDFQRLTTESIDQHHALDSLTKDLSTLKISIQEHNAALDGIKTNQEMLQHDITAMNEKVNDIKMRSHDGTLFWKLTNVQEKIGEQFMFSLGDDLVVDLS